MASSLRFRATSMAVCPVLLLAAGCELTEMVIAHPEDIIVVEAYLQLTLPEPHPESEEGETAGNALVLLHRAGGADGLSLDGSRVTLHAPGGMASLPLTSLQSCISGIVGDRQPEFQGDAICFRLILRQGLMAPGDEVQVEVVLPDERLLRGTTSIPGSFELVQPNGPGHCWMAPDTDLELVWTHASGAWAYASEATLQNLSEAFDGTEVVPPADEIVLQGISISAADTTMTFPRHFGVFGRFGSESGFLVNLQRGLPGGVHATIAVTAVDANHVRWLRGGSFNPSGRIRVPSVFEEGDGPGRATGVFGSSVRRMHTLEVVEDGDPGERCIASVPSPQADHR